jgi:two-component system, OmpR family, sensor kinase
MTLPKTLFGRLLLVFLLFGVVMTAALVYVMQVSHQQFHLEFDQTVNRDLARQYVASNFLLTDRRLTASTLHQGIKKLAAANPEIDIYLLDDSGGVVASSVPEAARRRTRVDLQPIKEFIAGRAAPVLADNPRQDIGKDVFSAAMFHVADCPADYLYLVLGRAEEAPGASRMRNTFAIREGAGVILLAGALAVALSLIFLRLLTRRLSVLEETMSRFQSLTAGSNEVTPKRRGGDEIDRLDALFCDLAARIEAQMAQLQSVDAARREMLANLSHDLRTPITTLLAHLESLQMDEQPLSEPERREYVAVAMRQSKRVAQLVEQLLEAAKLDARQIVANPELFLIGELLQDVVQKFALAARERGIELTLNVTPVQLRVYADIALLERVFDNLIDNALRHTPHGGRVTVSATPNGQRVRLAVADSGSGMTPEDAARVFDRFYRGDHGRSTASGQTGLGLAIVKSILELHGATISIDTRPGQGATFGFDLPGQAGGSYMALVTYT